jgi:hypothetical protein
MSFPLHVFVALGLALAFSGLLGAEEPDSAPSRDSSGIPYAWIEAAVSWGKVQAYNPNYGFGVVSLAAPAPTLKRGDLVAARRDGVIISRGFIESVETPNTVVVQFSPFTPDPDAPSRVRVGDELIPYPPNAPDPATRPR